MLLTLFKGEDLFGFLPLKRLMYIHTSYRWGFHLQSFLIWIRNINSDDSRITLNGAPYRFSDFVWFCWFFISSFADKRHLKLLPNGVKAAPDIPVQDGEPDKHEIITRGSLLLRNAGPANLLGWEDETERREGSWSVFSPLGTHSVFLPISRSGHPQHCDSPACFMLYCHRIKQFRGINTLLSLPPSFPSILEVRSLWFSRNERKAGWWFTQMKTTLNKFLLILSLLENDFVCWEFKTMKLG